MHRDTQTYLDAALALNETEGLLRMARRALVDSQWWPAPDRRRLHAEILAWTRSAEDLTAELAREPEASRVVEDLVAGAWDEVCRAGAPVDRDARVHAVIRLLVRPGRPPLPSSCPMGLVDLPQLGARLTVEAVRAALTLVAEPTA